MINEHFLLIVVGMAGLFTLYKGHGLCWRAARRLKLPLWGVRFANTSAARCIGMRNPIVIGVYLGMVVPLAIAIAGLFLSILT